MKLLSVLWICLVLWFGGGFLHRTGAFTALFNGYYEAVFPIVMLLAMAFMPIAVLGCELENEKRKKRLDAFLDKHETP